MLNMGSYRGNRDKVMADAAGIAERLAAGRATITGTMRRYRCAYSALRRAMEGRLTNEQWVQFERARRREYTKKGQFKKGLVPWNKGVRGMHLSPRTEFKKGRVATNLKPVGTIAIRKHKCCGPRTFIKVADNRRWGDWIPYAWYIWQRVHGPVPAGCLIVHKDGDALNDSLRNLVMVDRKGHIMLQQKRDPSIVKRMRANCVEMNRKRWARWRKEKARRLKTEELQQREIAKEAEQERRRLAKEAEDKKRLEEGRRQLEESRGRLVSWWECIGCGFEFAGEPKGICPKCNGLRFERIVQRISA